MKDYLTCPLSQEERDLITAIIWVTAKDYKKRLYKKSKHQLIPIDDVELSVEDEYNFTHFDIKKNKRFVEPLNMFDKEKIVEHVDRVLLELSLNKLKKALTFDEKLVLFLCIFNPYPEKHAAFLLQVKPRRIRYLKESMKIKKERFLGGNKNV